MLSLLLTIIQKASKFSTSSEGRVSHPPDGPLYYIILVGAAIIVAVAFYLAFKNFFWPGEEKKDHIKRKILENDF